jgi:hypothetical protein
VVATVSTRPDPGWDSSATSSAARVTPLSSTKSWSYPDPVSRALRKSNRVPATSATPVGISSSSTGVYREAAIRSSCPARVTSHTRRSKPRTPPCSVFGPSFGARA